MVSVVSKPGTVEKLEILSADAQYDLACACATRKEEHRKRGGDGRWIYPVTLANGGKASLFRTLVSNVCANDCKYCPLRVQIDTRRCTLTAEETAGTFLSYLAAGKVFGLFLTSGVIGNADTTMERLNAIAAILRKRHKFRGYIHLKILPGASDGAIEQALSLASAVSLNIETPGKEYFVKLCGTKDYERDIIRPMQLISKLTGPGAKYAGVCHTTQFVVGAADEPDNAIIRYTAALYERLKSHRVYFSQYQQGLGDRTLPGENRQVLAEQGFMREHRLYQVDWLLRKYGFDAGEIPFGEDGNLIVSADPKETWAQRHPERFPIKVNSAPKYELLRVPGLGPVVVGRILKYRKEQKLRTIEEIGKFNARLEKALPYLVFD